MIRDLLNLLPEAGGWASVAARVVITCLLVFISARLLGWLIWRGVVSRRQLAHRPLSERRRTTLRHLMHSMSNGLAGLIITLAVLAMFVEPAALLTALGLFSAGLGFAAKPFISDFLSGIVLVFEDQFALGDKVEIGDRNVMGVVEQVSLRAVHLRGESGELWIVPNGDVRTIRNFSRGSFSPANLKLTIPTDKLDETLALLLDIITEPGPYVLEQPEIISEEGEIGDMTTLLLKVKAEYGHAPLVRRNLLARVQATLTENHILGKSDVVEV